MLAQQVAERYRSGGFDEFDRDDLAAERGLPIRADGSPWRSGFDAEDELWGGAWVTEDRDVFVYRNLNGGEDEISAEATVPDKREKK